MTKELGIVAEGPWQLAGQLSGGNQQKVALARLLATECDVLLLDEPTRGVDVGSKAQLYSVLASMADRGVAILAVCSYIPELLGLCDRVAVMYRGQLGEARAASDINEQDVLRAATTGFSLDARGDAA
jgi:ribose transport system ATP-binding protein